MPVQRDRQLQHWHARLFSTSRRTRRPANRPVHTSGHKAGRHKTPAGRVVLLGGLIGTLHTGQGDPSSSWCPPAAWPAHHTGKGPVYRGHTREGTLALSAGQLAGAPFESNPSGTGHVRNSRLHTYGRSHGTVACVPRAKALMASSPGRSAGPARAQWNGRPLRCRDLR